jgi:heptosyltransferase-2
MRRAAARESRCSPARTDVAARGRRARAARDPGRLLVRLPNWLGDVLLARPMLHAIRAAAPQRPVMAVAPAPLLALLEPDRLFERAVPWTRGPAQRRAALAAARAFRPDTALVLPPSFSSAWFAWRSAAGERIGYAHQGRGALLTHALPRLPRGERHLSEEYLALALAADAAGAVPAGIPDLALDTGAAPAAEALLANAGQAAHAPLALFGPGATYGPAKQWGIERFAALGRGLAGRGFGVVVCGTAAEARACAELAQAIGTGAVSLAGQTSLPVLAALAKRADVAVCNDSGLAHLCAASGTPTVAVFGSTSSAWTAPLGRRVRIVQRAPVCAPCFQRTCRIGYRCLRAVEVADVERALAEAAA